MKQGERVFRVLAQNALRCHANVVGFTGFATSRTRLSSEVVLCTPSGSFIGKRYADGGCNVDECQVVHCHCQLIKNPVVDGVIGAIVHLMWYC